MQCSSEISMSLVSSPKLANKQFPDHHLLYAFGARLEVARGAAVPLPTRATFWQFLEWPFHRARRHRVTPTVPIRREGRRSDSANAIAVAAPGLPIWFPTNRVSTY